MRPGCAALAVRIGTRRRGCRTPTTRANMANKVEIVRRADAEEFERVLRARGTALRRDDRTARRRWLLAAAFSLAVASWLVAWVLKG
jgi:hypothetical protein